MWPDLAAPYEGTYDVEADLAKGGARHDALLDAARQELGFRKFLRDRNGMAVTHTFEDLHGLNQLPGLAPQRLMAEGHGFAGEGDWRTAALVRALKVMGHGLSGATSFMEDYTYGLVEGEEMVLGSHMLEICPSIAAGKPRMEIHPLGIGGKPDPVRLVFDAVTGDALNASLIDLGNRFRTRRQYGRVRSTIQICPIFRSRGLSGAANPTSPRPARHGYMPAALTTPPSAETLRGRC